jgi:uncharacterized membrane protein (UPF0127 family)
MRFIRIHNSSRPGISPLIAKYADTFLTRLRGYTFRRRVPVDEGLVLVQTKDSRVDSAIHMLGVFTDLGVVWINSQNEVVDVRLARSWRLAYIPRRPSRYVLEMNPSRLGDFQMGDRVSFEDLRKD